MLRLAILRRKATCVKGIVLQHAGVKHQIVFGLAGHKHVLARELGRQVVFGEGPPVAVQGLGREVHQGYLEPARLGQHKALPAAAAAGLQHSAAGGQQLVNPPGQVFTQPLHGGVDLQRRKRRIVIVPLLPLVI